VQEPVVPPEPPPPPEPAAKTYVVRKGDTVSGIAAAHGITVGDIVEINKLLSPNKIRVGQQLSLPGYASERAKPAREKKAHKTTGGDYVVQPGDTLSGIAAAFGTTSKAIREANGLSGDAIRAGAKLQIPSGKAKSGTPVMAPAAKPAPQASQTNTPAELLPEPAPEVEQPVSSVPPKPAM
jgi:LysM repeat protein